MQIRGVVFAGFVLLAASLTARALTISNITYVNWSAAVVGAPGGAIGSIVISNLSVGVTYTGEVAPETQTSDDGGINYWLPSTAYLSSAISNAPPHNDIITLVGGNAIVNTITFEEPINDPVMLIVSLGSPTTGASYRFDDPFEILSQGEGYWGSGFFSNDGNLLQGLEGHGAIQFSGAITSISWTVSAAENWHGFTIGAPFVADDVIVPEGKTWVAAAMIGAIASFGLWKRRSARR